MLNPNRQAVRAEYNVDFGANKCGTRWDRQPLGPVVFWAFYITGLRLPNMWQNSGQHWKPIRFNYIYQYKSL